MTEFVFGYGSLVPRGQAAAGRALDGEGFVCALRDVRRCWGVAMNNRVDLPGYKYYLDEDGDRPDVAVAFLDLRPARGQSVNGVCLPVDRDDLDRLDERERNYVRRDVTALCDAPPGAGPVWAYPGSRAGRRRFTTSRSAGRAVVDRAYLESVVRAFKRLGPDEYAACAQSLHPGGLPVLALHRYDLVSTTIGP